jgi:hypothetical protein
MSATKSRGAIARSSKEGKERKINNHLIALSMPNPTHHGLPDNQIHPEASPAAQKSAILFPPDAAPGRQRGKGCPFLTVSSSLMTMLSFLDGMVSPYEASGWILL